MSGVEEAITKLRVGIAKTHARLQDSFQDFDKLRSGTITIDQFKRCLSKNNVMQYLEEVDVAILSQSYPGAGGKDRFCYTKFLKDVNTVEVPANTIVHSSASPRRADFDQDSNAAVLAKVSTQFVHLIMTRSLDIALPFKGFDHHHQGKVTEAQFERAFPFPTEAHIMTALKQRYSDGRGSVEYKHWVDDMKRAVELTKARTAQTAAVSPTGTMAAGAGSFGSVSRGGNNLDSVQDLLEELRGQFSRSRVRVDETLKDFDKTHSGIITAQQFKSALGSIKLVRFVLTGAQLDDLVSCFQVPAGPDDGVTAPVRVNYRKFLNEVADSSIDVNSPPRTTHSGTQKLGDEDDRVLQRVLNKVRTTIRTQRMNMKPTFQDFDRASKGIYQGRTCTRTRFQRALAINKVNLSTAEVDLLEKKYSVRLPGEGDSDAINYVAFCADVDVDEAVEPVVKTSTAKLQQSLNGTAAAATGGMFASSSSKARSIDVIIDDVAQQCSLRRIRLGPFFRDFDALRSNSIPADKFSSAISMASVKLSGQDIEALVSAYAHETLPNACRYTAFVQAVDGQNVDLSGTAHLQPAAKNEDDARQLNEIHARIAKTVKSRGILLPPFFGDYDKHHCGRITGPQFQQTLSRHRFPVSTAEVELLTKHYSDSVDPAMVRYRPFLAAIDESEDVSLQHQSRLATRSAADNAPRATGSPESLEDTNRHVQQKMIQALRKGARVEEFFRDADGLRKGYIPRGKFTSALDMASIHFTDKELNLLVDGFVHPEMPDMVLYKHFMASIDALEQEDIQTRAVSGPAMVGGSTLTGSLPTDDVFFTKLVERIRKHKMTTRRASALDTFKDFDKLHKGRVTNEQFFAVLTGLGVRLSPIESDTLKSQLSCGNGELQYLAFARAVDKED